MKCILVFLLGLLLAAPALASVPEARDMARQSGCSPKKIEVVENVLGQTGRTVYRVECILPKMGQNASPQTASAVLVECADRLCRQIRSVSSSSNK